MYNLAHNFNSEESGYAAFAVTLLIMIIMSLITLGFANNARSEQATALNNQLSEAAYYAAESGINTAYSLITATLQQTGPSSGSFTNIIPQTKHCTKDNSGNNSYIQTPSNKLSSNTIYSCLLVNPSPLDLEYMPILQGTGETIPVQSTPPSMPATRPPKIDHVTINWEDANPVNINFTQCPSVGQFPPASSVSPPATNFSPYCAAPVLQVDIVPISSLAFKDPTTLLNYTRTIYLEPCDHTSCSGTIDHIVNGKVYGASCSKTVPSGYQFRCVANITMQLSSSSTLTGSWSSSGRYYFHIVPFYRNANLRLNAYSSGTPVDLYGAQAVIDATGNADGVLKRLEERICINTVCDNQAPYNAIQSDANICKYFKARPAVIDPIDSNSCPVG